MFRTIRLLSVLSLAALVPACAGLPGQTETSLPTGERIGEPVEAGEIVHFAVVDANPERFFHQTLLVEATVNAVCQKKGCWMQVIDEEATARVRWESGCGGRYTFPMDARGRRVVIQGSFYPTELSEEDLEHIIEEAEASYIPKKRGYEFNASAVILLDD